MCCIYFFLFCTNLQCIFLFYSQFSQYSRKIIFPVLLFKKTFVQNNATQNAQVSIFFSFLFQLNTLLQTVQITKILPAIIIIGKKYITITYIKQFEIPLYEPTIKNTILGNCSPLNNFIIFDVMQLDISNKQQSPLPCWQLTKAKVNEEYQL